MSVRFIVTTAVLLFVGLTLGGPANAATGVLTTTITATSVSSNSYGGCLAKLGDAVNTAVPAVNCPDNWVSFSCTGSYNSKDLAFYMLDQAQLALSLNKQVVVRVDDNKIHTPYCVATRIDVIK